MLHKFTALRRNIKHLQEAIEKCVTLSSDYVTDYEEGRLIKNLRLTWAMWIAVSSGQYIQFLEYVVS